ncbi:MAG: hypothetical protein IJQ81_05480 [Oscillibacter sp.]|nr:hypothetical protein [Oscillibacter sp.]
MEWHQLWYGLMYGVGVFVTCNVGGQVLFRLMAKPKRVKAAPDASDDDGRYVVGFGGEPVKIRVAPPDENRRRFDENRRQVDANRTDADAESDADTETGDADSRQRQSDADAPEESGTETDGDSMPYGEGRYQIRTA